MDNVTIKNSTINVTNSVDSSIYNSGGYLTIINSNIEDLSQNGTDLIYLILLTNIFGELSFNNTDFPEAYDLRNINGTSYLTPIKDQANGGNCWAFGSTAALEAYLLQYYNESWDFSENNIKNLMSNLYYEGWDSEVNCGGWNNMVLAYWARWSGPVNESDDPYNDTGSYSPENLTALKHVQDILFVPVYRNVDDLKLAILNYGSISYSLYATNFNKDVNGSIPISTIPYDGNHIISLVGWNDTFPGSNFGENISDGAFIIKNSWGNQLYF
ncbi:MAG: hypothetical protein MJ209_03100 [archaeon]|nr:hypothetical protein [archaeon]